MNRSHKSLLIVFLAGAFVLLAGLCWAQTKVQTQNPPQKKVVEQKKDDPPEDYTEEEYNAYQAAADETDPTKQAALIMTFMEKYPKSKLLPNVTPLYDVLLFKVKESGDFKKLEPLAEQWLKYKTNDIQLQAYIFDAAVKLSNHQKAVEYGEKIYEQKPSSELASIIYNNYEKLGNKAKKLEWHLKLVEIPEYKNNVELLWGLVVEYADKDLQKAALYADRTLKALPNAKKPANSSDAEWAKNARGMERGSLDVIGMKLYGDKQYLQALESLQKAVKVECYDSGYYYIAWCYWNMKQLEDAHDNFAIADLLGGTMSAKAKGYCLQLYKELHNGNDTGINKVYNRAKTALEACKK